MIQAVENAIIKSCDAEMFSLTYSINEAAYIYIVLLSSTTLATNTAPMQHIQANAVHVDAVSNPANPTEANRMSITPAVMAIEYGRARRMASFTMSPDIRAALGRNVRIRAGKASNRIEYMLSCNGSKGYCMPVCRCLRPQRNRHLLLPLRQALCPRPHGP